MTGGPLRRLQELALECAEGHAHVRGDEGGESGGLPVRVQLTQDPERLGMTYTAAHLALSPIRSQQ